MEIAWNKIARRVIDDLAAIEIDLGDELQQHITALDLEGFRNLGAIEGPALLPGASVAPPSGGSK